ncbi:ficolin-2-like, partial [Saccostrea cucullata]|uniref:ficolin-2-like n=1 Tax=Saccostrea cuccullata TaxID=36930 RepID=UPI002ED2DDE8
NDVIHQLTRGRNSSPYVSITLQNDTRLYQLYHQFSVSDEAGNYRLFLGGPVNGTLGDNMLNTRRPDSTLNGMSFSTPDRDNDLGADRSCAAVFKGDHIHKDSPSILMGNPISVIPISILSP